MKKANKKKINKDLKVKIPQTDIDSFDIKDMKIDPYWNDLYNPNYKNLNKK